MIRGAYVFLIIVMDEAQNNETCFVDLLIDGLTQYCHLVKEIGTYTSKPKTDTVKIPLRGVVIPL